MALTTGRQQEGPMSNTRKGVPDNSSVVIPRLVCAAPAAALDFVVQTFDAVVLNQRSGPDGALAHALFTIGPAMLMIEGEWPTLPSRAPKADGSSPVIIFVYVPDVDATVARAVENGAQVLLPLQNQFWGDRIAWLMDPSGHVWTVASRIEETTADERTDRWNDILAKPPDPR
jgi:PhnB protein